MRHEVGLAWDCYIRLQNVKVVVEDWPLRLHSLSSKCGHSSKKQQRCMPVVPLAHR